MKNFPFCVKNGHAERWKAFHIPGALSADRPPRPTIRSLRPRWISVGRHSKKTGHCAALSDMGPPPSGCAAVREACLADRLEHLTTNERREADVPRQPIAAVDTLVSACGW